MNKKTLKKKLLQKELSVGSWITIGNTVVAEIMAQSGYDWLTIDMEHSAITLDIAQDLIRIIELYNVTPLVRVETNDANLIKRIMDTGAHGVIVPMVNSAKEARQAVGAVKYPPEGFRGVGLARAQKYGENFEKYRQWNERESIVIVQIEHIKAVENLKDILEVKGIDAFIIGPYDLSGSLGIPGQFDHPDMIDALEQIKTTSKKMNAVSGIHVISPEIEAFQQKRSEGYSFIAHSLDILLLKKSCKDFLKILGKGV